jgi:nickel/cobalt exporter
MDNALMAGHYSWLYLPTAVALGALHGLEPGHSKTMMASFIIAIRGTVKQAVLLGLAATASHTAIIWALAAVALSFRGSLTAESVEPYLEILSSVIVFALAGWTAWRTWKSTHNADHHHHHHDHDYDDHDDHDRNHNDHDGEQDHVHEHHHDGPEAMLATSDQQALAAVGAHADDHERQHAEQIKRQFAGGTVTNGQILLFGLTGGLMPCPAAFTVLLLCLQGGQSFLGFSIVLAFSIGLAITLVGVGSAAAIGARYATAKVSSLGKLASNAPYLSSAVLIILGVYMLIKGIGSLVHG